MPGGGQWRNEPANRQTSPTGPWHGHLAHAKNNPVRHGQDAHATVCNDQRYALRGGVDGANEVAFFVAEQREGVAAGGAVAGLRD